MATIDQVQASLQTDTGRVRGHNEDYVGSWEPDTLAEQFDSGWLYIVADGVGGADAGEVASQMATEQTIHYFATNQIADVRERLSQAVQYANDQLRVLVGQRKRTIATTIVAVCIRESSVTFANVGDSRGYLFHAGTLSQVTRDQSLVAQLVAEGAITAEEALTHPRRNVILSSLGPTRQPKIDLFTMPVEAGDILLLCSDGLTRHVSDAELAEYVRQVANDSVPIDTMTQRLITLANERGGSDNISVGLLRLQSQESRLHPLKTNIVFTPPRNPARLRAFTALLATVEAVLILLIWYYVMV